MRKYKELIALAFLSVIAAGAIFLYADAKQGTQQTAAGSDLLSQVPAGAPTLVYIDLAAVRASGFYQHRPDRSPITVPDRNYASFINNTGFDFEKDLDQVVIASWPKDLANNSNTNKTVAIANGRFDRHKIREYALKSGKVEQQQSHEVFLFPANAAGQWNSMVFLNDHRIAIVEGSSAQPILSLQASDAATDPVRQRAQQVSGATIFAITKVSANTVSANQLSAAAGEGKQAAGLAALAGSLQWITLAARPEGDVMRVSLDGECQTSADAKQIQSTLQLLRMVGQSALQDPKTRQSMDGATLGMLEMLIKNADITQSAERVRILVEVTPEILKLGASTGNRAAEKK